MKYTTNLTALVSGVLLACTLMASAQVTIQWDKTYGSIEGDILIDVLATEDGGYLLAGESSGNISGDKSEDGKGTLDYWIVKVDEKGSKLWDKTIGGSAGDFLMNVIPSADGGYLLAGYSYSWAGGDKSENSKGELDYWVVKVDVNGNKEWDKGIGGNFNDILRTAIPTVDGGYLLIGDSESNISGDKSEDSKDTPENAVGDYWLVKINAIGQIEWDRTIGSTGGMDIPLSAVSTTDGGYLIAGLSNSKISGDKTENPKDEPPFNRAGDFWLVKTDANGNVLWDKTVGGGMEDILHNVITTPDGGFLLAGTSKSNVSGDKSEVSRGGSDYWIVKTDKVGDKLWDKTFGGKDDEILTGVTSTLDGNYMLLGTSYSNSTGDKSENSKGGSDYWVVKVDPNGNKLWDKTIGGDNADDPFDIIATLEGGYLLSGMSQSNISGDKSENNKSGESIPDFWVVKIQEQSAPEGVVGGLLLMNAKKDRPIKELKIGDILELSQLPRYHLNVQAQTSGKVGSIKFQLNGKTYIRNEAPFALFGLQNGNIASGTFQPGSYTLIATPYSKDNAQGEVGVPFKIEFEIVYRNTVADVIKRSTSFSELLAGLNQTGLLSTLVGPGPYTVFAPNDLIVFARFWGYSDIRHMPIDFLRKVLKYHIVRGQMVMAADLIDGMNLKTLQHEELKISLKDRRLYVNESFILESNLLGSNGVIHVISRVLIPPSLADVIILEPTASASPSLEMVAVADPVVNEVRVRTQGMENKTLAVTIMDYQGLYPQTYAYKLTDAQQEVVLDMRSYGPGLYILHAQVDQLRQSIKVEK